MEMASFSISDLWGIVRRRDLLPGVNGGVERLRLYRYGSLDLASSDRFWIFFLMVAVRRFILVIFVPATSYSTMVIRSPSSQ